MDHRDHDGLVMAVLLMEKDTKQNLYYTTPLLVFLVAIKKREREVDTLARSSQSQIKQKLATEAVHELDLLQIQMASSTQKDGYKVLSQNDS